MSPLLRALAVLASGDACQHLEQLRRARSHPPVVGHPAPGDAPVTVENEGRRPRHVAPDPAVHVTQPKGVDDLVVRIGQQAELDPVGLGDFSAVLDLVATDCEDLGVERADFVET